MNIEQIIEEIKQSACSECNCHKAMAALQALVRPASPAPVEGKPVKAKRLVAESKTSAFVPATKNCHKCGKLKSLADFSKKNGTKDGHEVFCKSCKGTYQKQWREKKLQAERAQPVSGPKIEQPADNLDKYEYPGLQCKLCKTIFSSKGRLASHMRTVHGNVL